jgi:hypothetical protein
MEITGAASLLLGTIGTVLGLRAEWRSRKEHRWKEEEFKWKNEEQRRRDAEWERTEARRLEQEACIAWGRGIVMRLEEGSNYIDVEQGKMEWARRCEKSGLFSVNSLLPGHGKITHSRT